MSVNQAEFIRLYVEDRKSIPDLAEITGLKQSTVRRKLIGYGVKLRSRAEGVYLARHKISASLTGVARPTFSEAWKKNIAKGRMASKLASGWRINSGGYIELTRKPMTGKRLHTVIAELIHGKLGSDEVVHHVDGDKLNNAPWNLSVMKASEHARIHREMDMGSRKRGASGKFQKGEVNG